MDISKSKRLHGDSFTVYTHCVRQGERPHDLWDFKENRPMPGWIYQGWCPSAATPIPESNWPGVKTCVAVLLVNKHDDGIEVWLHVPVTEEMLRAAFG